MIKLIDHWVLHRTRPAFDDKDSLTVIELVGKNTDKINEIIKEININIDGINKAFEEFTKASREEMDIFRVGINQKIKDFTDLMYTKLDSQDVKINAAVSYLKDNLSETIEEVLREMNETGELNDVLLNALENINTRLTVLENTGVSLQYNDETEELNLVGDETDETVAQMLEGEY